MSQVAIEKTDPNSQATMSVFDELRKLSHRIRQRAFEIFESRRGTGGSAVSDWLNAERDLLQIPESELIEKDGRYEVRLSAPGFEPGEVQVTVLPDALIVRATSSHRHDESEDGVRFCEFGRKTLFRRFDLPEAIDVDRVKADLEKGILCLTVPKAKREVALVATAAK